MFSSIMIGMAIGLMLTVISFFIPRCSILLQLGLIIGTQGGFIPQMAFLLGMCIHGGLSWATTLIPTYFDGDKKWDTETASTLCNSIAENCIFPSLFISLGAAFFLIGGGPQVYAGLSKYTVLLSLPLIVFFLVKKVKESENKTSVILGLSLLTTLAIGFLTISGSPLAMGAIVSVLMLTNNKTSFKHDPDKIATKSWSMTCTGQMWQALGVSTIMIGLPWSLVYKEPEEKDADKEIHKGMMELLSNHFSTLLFLTMGMARTAGADAMSKAITMPIDPLFAVGCIAIMVLLQVWVFSNMAALTESFLKHKPKTNDYWLSIGTVLTTCIIIGLPLSQCLIFIGAGVLVNKLIDKLNIRESIQGIFSSIPLIGIAFL